MLVNGLMQTLRNLGATRLVALAAVGFALIALGLWRKARLEEEFLRQELGADVYDSYRRRVPMLLPFGPKGALPWSFILVFSLLLGVSTTPAFKEARMNNVVRSYI